MGTEKNVYQKLQSVRAELAQVSLKKSGKNSYANFTYFELADFLPDVTRIFNRDGLTPVFSFFEKGAKLTIYNADKPEQKIDFYSVNKWGSVLKGMNDIQNVGAMETYQRRYLYLMALDLVEHDVVDALPQEKPAQKAEPKPVELTERELTLVDTWKAKINECMQESELKNVGEQIKAIAMKPVIKDALKTAYSDRLKILKGDSW